MEIRQKNLNHRVRLSRSLKVIGTDTYRSATDDFLLVVWSIAKNEELFRFRNERRFQSKIAKFSHPALKLPLKGSCRNFATAVALKKTSVHALLPGTERVTICAFV